MPPGLKHHKMGSTKIDKAWIERKIDGMADELVDISHAIHQHPEPGLQEYRARDLLVSKIAKFGFETTTPVAGLDTAFLARFTSGKPGPRIAFVAEYDALPDLGHGCGHNLIAAASFGAAACLQPFVSETGGSLLLIGTPDEEAFSDQSKGGKVVMAEAGIFDETDAALMMHPTGGPNAAWRYTFPLKDFTIQFVGKPAHYTRPEEGINALESLLLFLQTANALKRTWQPDVLFAYTITDGGGPSAITIPKTAEAHLTLKTFHTAYLDKVFKHIEGCLQRVAELTGARGKLTVLDTYKNMVPNLTLTRCLYRNLLTLGGPVENPLDAQKALEKMRYPGISTDFGDVSWCVPAIHGYCSLGGKNLVAHTPEFAMAAGGTAGDRAVLYAAKALAMTAFELFDDPSIVTAANDEFAGYAKGGFQHVPAIPPDFIPLPEAVRHAFELMIR